LQVAAAVASKQVCPSVEMQVYNATHIAAFHNRGEIKIGMSYDKVARQE